MLQSPYAYKFHRPHGANSRAMDSGQFCKRAMVLPLRLRRGATCRCPITSGRRQPELRLSEKRSNFGGEEGSAAWPQARVHAIGLAGSRVSSLGEDERPVLEPPLRRVRGVRRKGYYGLRTLAKWLCSVYRRHGTKDVSKTLTRPDRQQRELRAGELPLGHTERAKQQPSVIWQSQNPNSVGVIRGLY